MSYLDEALIDLGLANIDGNGQVEHVHKPDKFWEYLNASSDHVNKSGLDILAEAMNVFASYLIYFRSEYNRRLQEYTEIKREFNKKLTREMHMNPPSGSTVKEREAKAVIESDELQKLQEKVYAFEKRVTLLENFPDDIREKLNVYKKVYDARCEER